LKKEKYRQNGISTSLRRRQSKNTSSSHFVSQNNKITSLFAINIIRKLLKQSALIVGILWIISGLFKVSLLNKYNISLNFFSVDLIDDFPKYTLLILAYILFMIPYFTIKNEEIKPIISKLYLLIFGFLASVAIYLFNLSVLYSVLIKFFKINLYADNILLIVFFVVTFFSYLSYVSILYRIIDKEKSKIKSNKLTTYAMSFIKQTLMIFLIISVLSSSIYYMTSYKIPFINTYDIVEINSKDYVVLLNYGENLVVSEFEENTDRTISIHNSEYFIISPIGGKITERFYLDTKLDD